MARRRIEGPKSGPATATARCLRGVLKFRLWHLRQRLAGSLARGLKMRRM
jgi:hypothetical protein